MSKARIIIIGAVLALAATGCRWPGAIGGHGQPGTRAFPGACTNSYPDQSCTEVRR